MKLMQVVGIMLLWGRPPPPAGLDVRQLFRRFGADEWDAIREQFE